MVVWKHHIKCLGNDGLQGKQISAQGNTLGNDKWQKYNPPCKGKSIMNIFVLLPLQGDFSLTIQTPGRCPGLIAHWPFRPFDISPLGRICNPAS